MESTDSVRLSQNNFFYLII